MLRERGRHVQHKPVGVGIAAPYELRAALHQRGNEATLRPSLSSFAITRVALRLRYSCNAASSGVLFHALHFGLLCCELASREMAKDGGALCFRP